MTEIIRVAIPVLMVAVFIIFIRHLWRINQDKKAGFAIKDERTNRIEGKAAYITVHATGYFMLVLMWYVFANEVFELGLPVLETGWALIISLLFNIWLYLGLIFYLRKKED